MTENIAEVLIEFILKKNLRILWNSDDPDSETDPEQFKYFFPLI